MFDIDEVRAAVFWGCLKIPGIEQEASVTETGELSFALRHRGNMSLAEGTYRLLAARMPNEASEGTARSAIDVPLQVLSLPAERRAESELAESGPELEQLFRRDQHRSDKGTGKQS